MINKAVVLGRLTKDVNVRQTQNGISVAAFTIASDRQFKNKDGSRDADFINCSAWRKTADTLAMYTHKGSLVGIEGRLQTRSYQDKQGNKRFMTELVVDNFSLLDGRTQSDNKQSRQQQTSADPFAGKTNNETNISDNDLPF